MKSYILFYCIKSQIFEKNDSLCRINRIKFTFLYFFFSNSEFVSADSHLYHHPYTGLCCSYYDCVKHNFSSGDSVGPHKPIPPVLLVPLQQRRRGAPSIRQRSGRHRAGTFGGGRRAVKGAQSSGDVSVPQPVVSAIQSGIAHVSGYTNLNNQLLTGIQSFNINDINS